MTFAGTFDQTNAYNRRVTPQQSDNSRPPEQRREYLSPAERGLKEHQRVQKLLADAEAERQREQNEIRQRREKREQAQKAQQEFIANEILIDGEFACLTDEEKAQAWAKLIDGGQATIERAAVIALELKARRAA